MIIATPCMAKNLIFLVVYFECCFAPLFLYLCFTCPLYLFKCFYVYQKKEKVCLVVLLVRSIYHIKRQQIYRLAFENISMDLGDLYRVDERENLSQLVIVTCLICNQFNLSILRSYNTRVC